MFHAVVVNRREAAECRLWLGQISDVWRLPPGVLAAEKNRPAQIPTFQVNPFAANLAGLNPHKAVAGIQEIQAFWGIIQVRQPFHNGLLTSCSLTAARWTDETLSYSM